MSLRVLALPRYGALGASSRLRIYQYLPALKNAGLRVEIEPLFDNASLSKRYLANHYGLWAIGQCYAKRVFSLMQSKKFDLIWIEKEALPWWPQWFELALLKGIPYVLDFDDAVFHNYDRHHFRLVRRLYGKRLDGLMARSALVIGGNDYLVSRAIDAGASRVEVLPTVIDLKKYSVSRTAKQGINKLPLIVWIGSPTTVRYLEMLREPLQSLSLRVPFVLRVIGAEVNWSGINVECVCWTETSEVASIVEGDVGIMPLLDSAWERGKCGYKLIQYMACSLPVVASPVGVNTEMVKDGSNGFLAKSADDWVTALERLLMDADLSSRMGHEGRKLVEARYCLQITGPLMIKLLKESAERSF